MSGKLTTLDLAIVVVYIVGTTLLPQTPHSSFDQGAWMTPDALTKAVPEGSADEADNAVLARWRPGVSASDGFHSTKSIGSFL